MSSLQKLFDTQNSTSFWSTIWNKLSTPEKIYVLYTYKTSTSFPHFTAAETLETMKYEFVHIKFAVHAHLYKPGYLCNAVVLTNRDDVRVLIKNVYPTITNKDVFAYGIKGCQIEVVKKFRPKQDYSSKYNWNVYSNMHYAVINGKSETDVIDLFKYCLSGYADGDDGDYYLVLLHAANRNWMVLILWFYYHSENSHDDIANALVNLRRIDLILGIRKIVGDDNNFTRGIYPSAARNGDIAFMRQLDAITSLPHCYMDTQKMYYFDEKTQSESVIGKAMRRHAMVYRYFKEIGRYQGYCKDYEPIEPIETKLNMDDGMS